MIEATKEKLAAAKHALQKTIKKLLTLNRTKKIVAQKRVNSDQHEAIKSQIKLLNKVAKQQAKMVKLYESTLSLGGEKRQKDSA